MATANQVYRDFVTDGVPSSGPHKIPKRDIRTLLTGYEAIINAFTSNGGLVYSSLAALNADLAKAANAMAWVLGDPVAANNGVYGKVGGSGTGSWTRRADLPFSFIVASNVGAGTANAIQATTSVPVSGSALVWVNVAVVNTASPVAVSFNGGAALTIKANSGDNVEVGGLVPGMILLGVVSGSTFRLFSDETIAAKLYAARDAAEAARDIAAGYASDAVSQGNVPIYATVAGMPELTVPAGIKTIRVNGAAAAGDGLGGLYVDTNNGSTDTFTSADGRTWYRVGVAETTIEGVKYQLLRRRPRDVRMPVVPYGGGYLCPVDDTAIDLNLGSFVEAGSVTDTAKYQASLDRSHQTIVIDNANGRIFLTSIARSTSDLDGWVYEYDFSGGQLGPLIASSGTLPIGHGDFIALTQDAAGARSLWFYRPPSTEYEAGGDIVRVPWSDGVSAADINLVVSAASLSATRRTEVSNYDHDHLLLRADFDYIVSLADLEQGNLVIVDRRPWQWTPMPTDPTLARQQSLAICGAQASASGGFIAQPDYCWAGISTLDGRGALCDLADNSAALDDEVEGVSWYWNPARHRFEMVLSVWEWTPGTVRLVNLSTGAERPRQRSLGLHNYYWSKGSGSGGENSSGDRRVLYAPSGIGGTGVYIGGAQSVSRNGNGKFDPLDFLMEQWARGQGGRHGARIRARGGKVDLLFDFPEDTTVDTGVRLFVDGKASAHFCSEVTTIGATRTKGYAPHAKLEIEGGNGAGVLGTSSGANKPSFYSRNSAIDFASTGSIKFGTYNESTDVGSRFAYMQTTSFNPYVDNTYALGGASNRFSVVYAGTGAINTSDARTKTAIRSMTDAELSAAADLAREMGVFQFLASLGEKGDAARLHIGMTVQRAIEVMASHGLEPMRYGFICYDEWEAVPEQTTTEIDGDGNEITTVTEEAREAGSLYSFRPDQLALFILRGQEQRLSAVEAACRTLT